MPRISAIFEADSQQAARIAEYCQRHGLTLAMFARMAAARMTAKPPTKAERERAGSIKAGRPRIYAPRAKLAGRA